MDAVGKVEKFVALVLVSAGILILPLTIVVLILGQISGNQANVQASP